MPGALYYFFCLPVAAMTWWLSRRQRFDATTTAMLMAALLLYYFHFYASAPSDFTIDYVTHFGRVRYIAQDFFHRSADLLLPIDPAAKRSLEKFDQLATYYILAAAFYKLGAYATTIDPLMMVRHLSMLCYLGFLFFAVRTLRLLLPHYSSAYYAALTLLLFWPIGVTMGGRIHPDVPVFMAQMATIYCLVGWLEARESRTLANGFVAAGVAILFKTTSIIYLGMAGLCLVKALDENRHRLKTYLSPRLLLSIVFAGGCRWLSHLYFNPEITLPTMEAPKFGWLYLYMHFNPAIFVWDTMVNPFTPDALNAFWHFFLRSLLVGEGITWKPLVLLFVIGVMFLAQCLYIAVGLAWRRGLSRREHERTVFFAVFACALIGAMLYLRFRFPLDYQMSSARYVFPVIVIFVLAYGKAMEGHARAGRDVMVRVGNGLALGTALLTIALFLSQHVFLSRIQ